MPTLRLEMDLSLDGESLPGFPLVRQLQSDIAQVFDYQVNPGDPVGVLPDSIIASLRALLIRTTDPLEVQLNGVAGVTVHLQRGGIILLFDVNNVGDKAATNNTLQNIGTLVATTKGVALGSGG
jgi:hypothetical protein